MKIGWVGFFVKGSFVFRSFFSARVVIHRPHCVVHKQASPLVVPSEAYAHGGWPGTPLISEGRRTEDAQQSRKKKTMKTTSQKNNIGTREQIRTVEQQTSSTAPERKDTRLPIDTEARKKNRTLPTEKVLNLLQTSAPELFSLAEVV